MSYIFKKCSGGNADDVMKKILDPDNNPLGEGEIDPDVYTAELEMGKLSRSSGAERDDEYGFRMIDYIPVNSRKFLICNFEPLSDGTNEICMISYTADYQATGWFAYLEDGQVCDLAESPQGTTYLRGYFSPSVETATVTGQLTVTLTSPAEHKKIYIADHGYSVYGDNIDYETMHKIVISAEGKDGNSYNITEIKAPPDNPEEATLALMNWGNGRKQFVDFSSMTYEPENPTVEIVCQTRDGEPLPKFSVRFNNGDGNGRVKKFVVHPDAIPIELTSAGLKVRSNNSFSNDGAEEEFLTVNLYDFFKNAENGGSSNTPASRVIIENLMGEVYSESEVIFSTGVPWLQHRILIVNLSFGNAGSTTLVFGKNSQSSTAVIFANSGTPNETHIMVSMRADSDTLGLTCYSMPTCDNTITGNFCQQYTPYITVYEITS